MATVYTVAQVNNYIKNMFSQDFLLRSIYVKGEISNCKYHTSGHIYFTLKDRSGTISAVMFAGNRKGLKFRLEEGQQVIVFGNISVYERDGKYQLYATEIVNHGAGVLYQKFQQLKKELSEMGLFDKMYKKPIPKYSMNIGICTAKTGAAIQDIINVSSRRNPFVQLYLYPALVQGEAAAADIVNGLRCLDNMNLDVIILGRGGGSMEDLWAFNEESVAKAIFDCRTPVISAVGHETDVTIADFVADLRAPTPSAAAELTVFDYSEFRQRLNNFKMLFTSRMKHCAEKYRSRIKQYETAMQVYNPSGRLQTKKQYVADLSISLWDAFDGTLKSRQHSLAIYAEKLNGLSPLNRISKGFAYVTDNNGRSLKTVSQVNMGDDITLIISDGVVKAAVTDVKENQDGR